MKRLFTLIILMVAMLPAFSQRIVVEKNNNATQAVDLHNFQRITFNGSVLNILQTNGTATSTEMSDIVRIYFDDYTRINEVDFNDGKELVAYISPDEIAVNCEAGEEIAIYNISGTLVLKERQDSEGGSISITNLPKGLYLLRANSQTVKILKR